MDKKTFLETLLRSHLETKNIPSVSTVRKFYEKLLIWMFPEFCEHQFCTLEEIKLEEVNLKTKFKKMLKGLDDNLDFEILTENLFNELPNIYSVLKKDLQAILEGDPAATSTSEVIRSYPGFYAIVAYRIAHQILKLNIPILPRMITEFAHEKTGIDIHPGAKIGEYFCIDHGTGVVIGETTLIGNNVKLYQGVTLGALSVHKEDAKSKRHPTLEDNVIVYAGSTILGGNTIIGKNSIIGGNVWLTRSIAEGTKIYYQTKMFDGIQTEGDTKILG